MQADLQVAQSAAADAARELEEARAEDREAKQVREQAIRGKKQAEREKGVAESQLEELTSQQPDDADAATSALQDALKAISDKDAEIRVLQQKVPGNHAGIRLWCMLTAGLLQDYFRAMRREHGRPELTHSSAKKNFFRFW